eukprot:760091-Hanusia_phi.AAC.1
MREMKKLQEEAARNEEEKEELRCSLSLLRERAVRAEFKQETSEKSFLAREKMLKLELVKANEEIDRQARRTGKGRGWLKTIEAMEEGKLKSLLADLRELEVLRSKTISSLPSWSLSSPSLSPSPALLCLTPTLLHPHAELQDRDASMRDTFNCILEEVSILEVGRNDCAHPAPSTCSTFPPPLISLFASYFFTSYPYIP